MLFSSLEFIFRFLPLFFLCYFVMPARGRNAVLLLGSLVFYAIGEPLYILLMIGSIFVNYGAARLMAAARSRAGKRLWLIAVLLFDLGALFVFKYFDFFAANVNALAGGEVLPLLELELPLGISFYTFQIISYVADLYTEKLEAPGTLLEFGTYVCMFPQLIAGPILQYREVSGQLRERRHTVWQVEQGLELFCLGLGSKVLLANKISIFWNQVQGIGFSSISTPVAWMGAAAFSFEIYFDFWGYSLMAMGLGRMMGFTIPRNFSVPYMACSATEFWRRWHITLGRFFREYVYIPLGGNRGGRLRTVFNLFLVWALTGLWHGASWNFVVWGLGFFVLLVLEKNLYGDFLERHSFFGHLYVWLLVPVSWMVFEITDFSELVIYLKQMAGIHAEEVMVSTQQLLRYLQEYGWLFALCALCATWFPVWVYRKLRQTWWLVIVCFAVFWLCVYELSQGAANPFLYFRF
ncbi:MBOAT family O-acyltransferase [Lachnospiraceae bacterium 47-T17]